MIGFFLLSFWRKHEILWALTFILSGFLMLSSYNIEYTTFEYNVTLTAYQPVIITNSYPYMMAINMVFMALALILGLFDLFGEYGGDFASFKFGKDKN